ncbi:MAG: DMT family transporter [Rhodobacteraceae bacterium]|nr:DMT family transporter [Paracoccaceae bacterium]
MTASDAPSSAHAPSHAPSALRAALWMIGSFFGFSLMAVAGRELSGDFTTFEIMFWRSLVGLAIVAGFLSLSRRGFGQVRTQKLGLHGLRNTAHFFGQNCWFYAVGMIPLAQVFAFEFTSPIWVAALAPLLLGERFTLWRGIAVALGFLGVLVVAQPFGFSTVEIDALRFGQIAAAAAALGFAGNFMATKRLSDTETILCIMFYMTLMQAVMALVCALAWSGAFPTPPSGAAALWMVVVGLCGLAAHYCVASALGAADATVVAPMDFLRLPLIAVVGALLYAEALDPAVFVGGVLVFLGNFLNLRAERLSARRSRG